MRQRLVRWLPLVLLCLGGVFLAWKPGLAAESVLVPCGSPVNFEPRITARFGPRIFFGQRDFHRGVDLGVAYGTPVYATHAGVVRFEWTAGGGYWVEVENGLYKTRYAHLSRRVAQPGTRVVRGTLIGYSGNSGSWSTGPHLHYEVWKGGRPVDPVPFLRE